MATPEDIQRIESQIADLKAVLDRHSKELATQLTRIAQLQADIDLIRAAWSKIAPPRDR